MTLCKDLESSRPDQTLPDPVSFNYSDLICGLSLDGIKGGVRSNGKGSERLSDDVWHYLEWSYLKVSRPE